MPIKQTLRTHCKHCGKRQVTVRKDTGVVWYALCLCLWDSRLGPPSPPCSYRACDVIIESN